MLDVGQLFMWFMRFLNILWKIAKPILMFTGLIWPAIVLLIDEMFFGSLNRSAPVWWWIVAWVLCAYTFAQNITRKITKDPSLKLYKLLLGWNAARSEAKLLNPDFDAAYYSDKPEGFPLGKQKNKWVRLPDDMPYHALVTGGSGTGKSSSFCIPLLLKTAPACFVVDIKGELYEKTAKPNSLVFDPTSITACGYNPFNLVSKQSQIQDITTIANSLIPASPGKNDEFWDLEAQNYLAGSLLYLYKHGYNFTDAMRHIQSQNAAKFISEAVADGDPDVNVLLGHFDGMAENTLSGITATVSSKIMVFASDPDIMRCFSMPDEKCIKPQDLLNGRNIYLCIPEARLEQYRAMTSLIIGQFLKFFEKQPDASKGTPRVNFVLDEFYRLGKLGSVEMGLSTLRSKGVRMILICQSNAQIEKLYDKVGAKIIMDNAQVKILLGATDVETQEFYSKLTGTYDKTKKSFSDNKGDFKVLGSSGTSITTEEKRLIKPEHLATLGDQAIVFTPTGWGKVKKQPYYKTPEYSE